MAHIPASTVKVTDIEPHSDGKVLIRMEMLVDVHRLAEVGSVLLSVAAKGASQRKK
jgi:hypothetical protein